MESLEDRLCLSAADVMPDLIPVAPEEAAENTPPDEIVTLNYEEIKYTHFETEGQGGSDLLIVNNGDGSDFLEGTGKTLAATVIASNLDSGSDSQSPVDSLEPDDVAQQGGTTESIHDENDLLIVNNGDGSDFLEGVDAYFATLEAEN